MAWLLYALLVYVAACYLGGLYLALRLAIGRRLTRRLARVMRGDTRGRPTRVAPQAAPRVVSVPLSAEASDPPGTAAPAPGTSRRAA